MFPWGRLPGGQSEPFLPSSPPPLTSSWTHKGGLLSPRAAVTPIAEMLALTAMIDHDHHDLPHKRTFFWWLKDERCDIFTLYNIVVFCLFVCFTEKCKAFYFYYFLKIFIGV